jgi:hypothetical protein
MKSFKEFQTDTDEATIPQGKTAMTTRDSISKKDKATLLKVSKMMAKEKKPRKEAVEVNKSIIYSTDASGNDYELHVGVNKNGKFFVELRSGNMKHDMSTLAGSKGNGGKMQRSVESAVSKVWARVSEKSNTIRTNALANAMNEKSVGSVFKWRRKFKM